MDIHFKRKIKGIKETLRFDGFFKVALYLKLILCGKIIWHSFVNKLTIRGVLKKRDKIKHSCFLPKLTLKTNRT